MVSKNHSIAPDEDFSDLPAPAIPSQIRHKLRIIGVLLLAPLLLSVVARHWWLADICANLRVQWTIALTVVLLLAFFCADRRLAAFTLLALASQIPWFHDSVMTNDVAVGSSEFIIMTANVYTANRRHDDVLREFLQSNADIIVVVELSSRLAAFLDRELSEVYPYSVTEPQDAGNFGIGVYSKHHFDNADIISFGRLSIPSIAVSTSVRGQPLRLVATHTLPPMGPGSFHHRNNHLDEVADFVGQLRAENGKVPVIVAGDLNLTPWSPIFHDFCVDADLMSNSGNVWNPTWYRYPWFPFGLVLDHVLFTSDLQCSRRDVGNDVGSDHRFVTAVLTAPNN